MAALEAHQEVARVAMPLPVPPAPEPEPEPVAAARFSVLQPNGESDSKKRLGPEP
jgi:hypothetical protein